MSVPTGVDVIVVPYDSGRRDWRMGAGPLRLVEHGLPDRLRALGLDVRVVEVGLADVALAGDQRSAYPLAADVARAVGAAHAADRLPLVLAGNCSSALGTVTGAGAGTTGVVWFDAHGDFNTPETSPSGFLDGMSLATLTGRCQAEEAARIPGFSALADDVVVLAGARDFDAAERRALDSSGVRLVGAGPAIAEELAAALEGWPESVTGAYVHVDLDVLDASEARVNEYAAPGGLALPDLLGCIDAIAAHARIAAAALTALDPAIDRDGRAAAAAIAVAEQIVARASVGWR